MTALQGAKLPVPRHVLFVHHSGVVGGAELSLLGLARGLRERGTEVTVACAEEGPLRERCLERGIRCLLPGFRPPELARPWQALRSALRLHRLIRQERPSIVHANSFLAMKALAPLARWCPAPIACSIRDILPFTRLTCAAIARADAVICISKAAAENLAARFAASQRHKIRVIYNGIELERFAGARPDREIERLRRAGFWIVGCFSPIVRWKGQTVLLEALARLPQAERQRLRVLLVGHDRLADETYRAELESWFTRPALTDCILPLGFRENVEDLMAAVDVVVIPSREPDAITRVAAEAMAAGKPVVASRIGGLPEAIEHERTGLLVPPADPEALARALRRLLLDPQLARALGEAGRVQAEKFSLRTHVEAMLRLYSELRAAANPRWSCVPA